jgi:hypothetical protein
MVAGPSSEGDPQTCGGRATVVEGQMAQKTKFRLEKTDDPQDTAWAIHYCLKYMSQDALTLGMSQTANLLDMIAHLAVDEAKAIRYRN